MVKIIERFIVKAPHDGQPSVFGGTVLETLSNGQVVESQLAIVPVEELSQWIPSLNAQLLVENQSIRAERDKATADLAKMTTERDTALSEKAALTAELDSLQSQATELTNSRDELQTQLAEATTGLAAATGQVEALTGERDSALEKVADLEAELDAIKNPPNPFPDADWQGFRSAALASPVIMRMAVSNIGNFMMLLIYLTEMQKDPATSLKMAAVWNEMETKTPLSPEEIAGINALAAHYQVPMVLNSEGQIVLP